MDLKLEFLTHQELRQVVAKIKGVPSENRVLILTHKGEVMTQSGILLPTVAKESLPKKGMIVQQGEIGDEYKAFKFMEPGDIVTYGMYAGKEIELPYLGLDPNKWQLTILSLNEILYIERF